MRDVDCCVCGIWATLLRCPHIHRLARAAQHDGARRTQTGALTACGFHFGKRLPENFQLAILQRSVRADCRPLSTLIARARSLHQSFRTAVAKQNLRQQVAGRLVLKPLLQNRTESSPLWSSLLCNIMM
jgi:hypothetical protein